MLHNRCAQALLLLAMAGAAAAAQDAKPFYNGLEGPKYQVEGKLKGKLSASVAEGADPDIELRAYETSYWACTSWSGVSSDAGMGGHFMVRGAGVLRRAGLMRRRGGGAAPPLLPTTDWFSPHLPTPQKLFGYISGANSAKAKIDMTVPVITKVTPGQGPTCGSK